MGKPFKFWLAIPLWKRILAALVIGAVVGIIAGEQISSIKWVGDLFIRLIRMLIVPLVFITLVAGITAMKEPARIASIGTRAFALYLGTTFIAIVIGMFMAAILRPGGGIDLANVEAIEVADAVPLSERMMAIVPHNVFTAYAEGDILAIIFFGVLLGAGILLAGNRGQLIARAFEAGSEVMLKVTGIVMEFAPIGVFALVAWVLGTEGPGAFVNIFMLALIVYLGGAIHMLVTHGGLARWVGGIPISSFFRGARTPPPKIF